MAAFSYAEECNLPYQFKVGEGPNPNHFNKNFESLKNCIDQLKNELTYLKENAFSALPIGSLLPFAGPIDLIPKGWLPCDERAS